MPGTLLPAHWSDFIRRTADAIEPMLSETNLIGFCFSYPAEVTPDIDSRFFIPRQLPVKVQIGRYHGDIRLIFG